MACDAVRSQRWRVTGYRRGTIYRALLGFLLLQSQSYPNSYSITSLQSYGFILECYVNRRSQPACHPKPCVLCGLLDFRPAQLVCSSTEIAQGPVSCVPRDLATMLRCSCKLA